MSKQKPFFSNLSDRYQSLLELWWGTTPAFPSEIYLEALRFAEGLVANPARIDSAAVALGQMADVELRQAGCLLTQGHLVAAWDLMDTSQAHAKFLYDVMEKILWRPSGYTTMVFQFDSFCTHFAMVLARGSLAEAHWYAQQLLNLKLSGLADQCCGTTEYVDFYVVMAQTLLDNRWPSASSLPATLGPYAELVSADDQARQREALVLCASHHLEIIEAVLSDDQLGNDPFLAPQHGAIAYELAGFLALYKRVLGNPFPQVQHPMLFPALLSAPPSADRPDKILIQLRDVSKSVFGEV